MLDVALTAAAVVMLLIAIRTLFVSSKKDGSTSKQGLGCGFAVVATALWVYVLRNYLGELGPAVMLGVAILLALPAVQAIADPGRGRIVRAILGLIVAILIAGPVLVDLWEEHGPDTRPASARALDDKKERRAELASMAKALQKEIKSHGATWEAIEGNEEALKKLATLDNVNGAIAVLDAEIAVMEANEEGGDDASSGGIGAGDPALEEFQDATPLEDLSIVEQHARKKKLKELFESDL